MAEHEEETGGISRFTDRQRDLWNAALKVIADRGWVESLALAGDRTSLHLRTISLAMTFDLFIDKSDESRRESVEIRKDGCILFSAAVVPMSISDSTRVVSAAVMVQMAGGWEEHLLRATEHLPMPGPMEVVVHFTCGEE